MTKEEDKQSHCPLKKSNKRMLIMTTNIKEIILQTEETVNLTQTQDITQVT